MDTQLQVILPYDRPAQNQQSPCKVLYLLHGLGGNSTAWCRYTAVELYAREHGLAVVMPEVQKSFYVDMKLGLSYFTYVAKELPELCSQMFHISSKREDNFIAGLSMGGYGAFHCGFTYPEQYAGVASFSGALDLNYIKDMGLQDNLGPQFMAVFGPDLQLDPENDIMGLAANLTHLPAQQRPRILMQCGKQDYLYEMNLHVKRYFQQLSLDFHWEDWDGIHDWVFWEQSIQKTIPWLLSPQ